VNRTDGTVTVVGITDAGKVSLLPDTLRTVDGAELLCGGRRHLAFFPDFRGERLIITGDLDRLVERLRGHAGAAVVLASGDPCCHGIGPMLVQALGAERVRLVPNLSVVQLAFARLGVSWQHAAILSAHGRPVEGILPSALYSRVSVIFTDAQNTPSVVARTLLAAGSGDWDVDVFEHLGGATERHTRTTLGALGGQVFDPLNLLVVRQTGPLRSWPIGLGEDWYSHERGMITKSEVRAVSLAKLRLGPESVLWDVGAGCGSVSVEASALLPGGRVYAVERDQRQIEHLVENRRSHGAGNLVIVPGEAPAVLHTLPDPDAVFVGGSGGQIDAIFEVATARVRPGGRVVFNLATLDHLHRVSRLAAACHLTPDVTQVSISRGVDVAGLTRLDALNPVFVFSIEVGRGTKAGGTGDA
jgi:precorrin-6Y C5,15-methyltransferase (decarboxylating)